MIPNCILSSRRDFKLQVSKVLTVSRPDMVAGTALQSAKAWWDQYARKAALGSLELDLVPLEEHHRLQMEQFQDQLDAETVYLRHGGYLSAAVRKAPQWLERQWNTERQSAFSQGAFLNGRLIGIGSIYKLAGGKSAEAALVIAPEFQGMGRGSKKGVGGLLLEDLIRYARDQQLERVIAYFVVHNPRCEKLLRKYGVKMAPWSHLNQEGSAVLDLSRHSSSAEAHAEFVAWDRDVRLSGLTPA